MYMEKSELDSLESKGTFEGLDSRITDILSSDNLGTLNVTVEDTTVEEVIEHLREVHPNFLQENINFFELSAINSLYSDHNILDTFHCGSTPDLSKIPLCFLSSKENTLYFIPLTAYGRRMKDVKVVGRTLEHSAVIIKTIYRLLERMDGRGLNLKFGDLDSEIADILSTNKQGNILHSFRKVSIEDLAKHIQEKYPTSTMKMETKLDDKGYIPSWTITSNSNLLYITAEKDRGNLRVEGRTDERGMVVRSSEE